MRRELMEETSIKNFKIIREIKQLYEYELPSNLIGIIWKGKFRGQKQKWFIVKFLGEDYDVNIKDNLDYTNECSIHEIKEFSKHLNLTLVPREYQIEAISHCIRNDRSMILSPTASGKSLIIYLLTQFYQEHRTLIIVPTISLVKQMAGDFEAYGYKNECKLITGGVD